MRTLFRAQTWHLQVSGGVNNQNRLVTYIREKVPVLGDPINKHLEEKKINFFEFTVNEVAFYRQLNQAQVIELENTVEYFDEV